MNYINRIFGKYMRAYKTQLRNRIGSLIRSSDTMILKVALDEMYKVLDIISGRMVSKMDIPHAKRFPSSKQWNTFLEHLEIDFDKLYAAQKIIVEDIQNVVNYNSTERENIAYKLSKTQASVYQAYISSQKGISGTTIIREDFKTEDSANNATNLEVDESVKRLSLRRKKTVIDSDSINTGLIDASHFNVQPNFNLYPNSMDLSLGAFWDVRGSNKGHFEQRDNENYRKNFIIKRSESSRDSRRASAMNATFGMVGGQWPTHSSINSCQVESVLTVDANRDIHRRIEEQVSRTMSIPKTDIMVNRPDSIWEQYILPEAVTTNPEDIIKLQIPILDQAKLSTGLIIKLNPNDNNNFPTIDDSKSFAITRIDRQGNVALNNKVRITSMSPVTEDQLGNEGVYTIEFEYPIDPSYLELVFSYGGDGWANISYNARIYRLQLSKVINLDITLEGGTTETEPLFYTKNVYIVLDKEIPYINAIRGQNTKQEYARRERIFYDEKGVK